MKLTRIFQHISIAVMITAFSLTSCDYLDVVPPEQPNIDDAMSSPTRALGFLFIPVTEASVQIYLPPIWEK